MKKTIILPLLLVASLGTWAQKDTIQVKKDNREVKVIVKGGNKDDKDKEVVVYKKYVVTDTEDLDEVMDKIKEENNEPSDPKKEIRKQIIIVDGNDKGKVIRQIDINVPNLDSLEKVIETEIAKIDRNRDANEPGMTRVEKKVIINGEEVTEDVEVSENVERQEVEVEEEGDTTTVVVGKRKIIITKDGVIVKKRGEDEKWAAEVIENEHGCDKEKKGKPKRKSTDVDWFGLDLGLNNYFTKGEIGRLPENSQLMKLNTWQSIHVATHFLPTRVSLIGRGAVNLKTALSVEFNNLNFANDFDIDPNASTFAPIAPTAKALKTNKMVLTYGQIPLLLNFNTKPGTKKGVSLSVGGFVGYLLDAKIKHVDIDGKKNKNHDDYQINPVKYGLTARMDFKWFDFYVNYNMSELFVDNSSFPTQNPKTQLVSAGINLLNF